MKMFSIRKSLTYSEMLERQLKEFNLRVECRKQRRMLPEDVVFFVEHLPVYTIGRHGDYTHLLLSAESLATKGIDCVEIGRGGDITYHGPGQLTVYPIVDLQRLSLGVKDYVNLLEDIVIRTIAEYGIVGERIEGKTGVWIGKGTSEERKICAIGIRCSRHVSMHGFALNVSSDIKGFGGIVPCGLPQGVTSVSLEINRHLAEEGQSPQADVLLDEVELKLRRHLKLLLQPRIPFPETA